MLWCQLQGFCLLEDQICLVICSLVLFFEHRSLREGLTASDSHQTSADSIAISLLKQFSEKHLPKASELIWLVSERDAPQQVLSI